MKKRSDFCLGVEGWSTGFEVAGCETEWCDTPSHGKKKSLRATASNRWVISTVIRGPRFCGVRAHFIVQQQTVSASINKTSRSRACYSILMFTCKPHFPKYGHCHVNTRKIGNY